MRYRPAMRRRSGAVLGMLAVGLVLGAAGCADGRHNPGFVIGGDGATRYSSAANVKLDSERTIERSLDHDLGPGWSSQVAIADEPRFDDVSESWRWPATSVAVTLRGTGPSPLPVADMAQAIQGYFANRLAVRGATVSVGISVEPPASTAVPSEGAPSLPCRYTIQTGDSLETLSARFYGSSEHWRRILDANPGLSLETMRTGHEIVIPAL